MNIQGTKAQTTFGLSLSGIVRLWLRTYSQRPMSESEAASPPALDFAALADGLLLSQSTGDGTAAEVEAAALEGSTLDYDQSSTSSESPPSAHRRTDDSDGD